MERTRSLGDSMWRRLELASPTWQTRQLEALSMKLVEADPFLVEVLAD
jgi:hypothetical protein